MGTARQARLQLAVINSSLSCLRSSFFHFNPTHLLIQPLVVLALLLSGIWLFAEQVIARKEVAELAVLQHSYAHYEQLLEIATESLTVSGSDSLALNLHSAEPIRQVAALADSARLQKFSLQSPKDELLVVEYSTSVEQWRAFRLALFEVVCELQREVITTDVQRKLLVITAHYKLCTR